MSFHVGQKVVCVDSDSRHGINDGCRWLPGEEIHVGQIYTISRLWVDAKGYLVVDLFEKKRVQGWWPYEVGYMRERFRPLVTKSTETGMAILREILDRESVDERQRVPIPAPP